MQAIILAGGLGTRLRPVVSDVPKALAIVRGRPFVEHLLLRLRRQGYGEAILCVGHLADQIVDAIGTGEQLGMRVTYSVESSPLGTGGALKLAQPLISDERFFLLNGDSFLDIWLPDLAAAHELTGARATIALVRHEDAGRYGTVDLADDGSVRSFIEKSEVGGPALINAGVYVVEREVLDFVEPNRPVSFEREVLPALIGNGLHGSVVDGFFIDIGIPEDFERAQYSIP